MSYQGIIKNGQILLPEGTALPEGASVVVDIELRAEDFPDWSRDLIPLIKMRNWPTDMALNHDHYLHGTPKK